MKANWCSFFGGPADGAKLKIADDLQYVRVLFDRKDLHLEYWDQTTPSVRLLAVTQADVKRYTMHLYERTTEGFLHAGAMVKGKLAAGKVRGETE